MFIINMPFTITKVPDGYKLYNSQKKKFVPVVYKTRKTARSAGSNFMKYRGEKPKIKG
jgi:hypothetical protein